MWDVTFTMFYEPASLLIGVWDGTVVIPSKFSGQDSINLFLEQGQSFPQY